MKRTLLVLVLLCVTSDVYAEDVSVTNAAQLREAINAAEAGDVITLEPGTYAVDGNLRCNASGTSNAPIIVRSAQLGDAIIAFDTVEGFVVDGAYWTFENLEIEGVCASDSDCEHAFHVVGGADFTTIRNNKVRNFNAQIKGNGNSGANPRPYPDDVLIERNTFYATRVRDTSNPVTPIDVVGGRRWIIRQNFIYDFAKGQGNEISYAAFLKGNSRDGLFEQNLVVCELNVTGGTRLGLSFGGGGTAPDTVCEDDSCTPEHQNGVMRNNLIVNCSDVGIYLNKAANVEIFNNTLFRTNGIDARFPETVAEIRNNLLDASIRERDGGIARSVQNVENGDLGAWFTNPASLDFSLVDGSMFVDLGGSDVVDDFCVARRSDGNNDIGAIEYGGTICDTSSPFNDPVGIGGDSGFDTGIADGGGESDVSVGSMDMSDPIDAGRSVDVAEEPAPTGEAGSGCCGQVRSKPPSALLLFFGLLLIGFRRRF